MSIIYLVQFEREFEDSFKGCLMLRVIGKTEDSPFKNEIQK